MADMINSNRLKKLRKKNEYKQIDLANILGVGRSTYAKYEAGTIQPPNDQVVKIAKLFKVTSDFLLNLSDDSSPKNEQKETSDILSDEFDTIMIDGELVKLEGQMKEIAKIVYSLPPESLKQANDFIRFLKQEADSKSQE